MDSPKHYCVSFIVVVEAMSTINAQEQIQLN